MNIESPLAPPAPGTHVRFTTAAEDAAALAHLNELGRQAANDKSVVISIPVPHVLVSSTKATIKAPAKAVKLMKLARLNRALHVVDKANKSGNFNLPE